MTELEEIKQIAKNLQERIEALETQDGAIPQPGDVIKDNTGDIMLVTEDEDCWVILHTTRLSEKIGGLDAALAPIQILGRFDETFIPNHTEIDPI